MEWSKVKTSLILMLAVVNCFLAAVYFVRLSEVRAMEKNAVADAAEALRKNGVVIDTAILERSYDSIYIYEAERDTAFEGVMAKALTGSDAGVDQGAGAVYYEGPYGWARFGSAGNFEIGLTGLSGIAEHSAEDIFSLMGIYTEDAQIKTQEEESGYSAEITQNVSGIYIENCKTKIYYRDGEPFHIEGRRINGKFINTGNLKLDSVITVIIDFVADEKKNNIEFTNILDIKPCYRSDLRAPGFYRLTPIWEITTNTGNYYINMALGVD